jgi:hypothetical protein
MTEHPALGDLLDEYHGRLQLQVVLLERLLTLASRQHDASLLRDSDALASATNERDEVMKTLLDVEREQRPARDRLATMLDDTPHLPHVDAVRRLHRRAEACIAEILTVDGETSQRLEQTDHARRGTAQNLETGEATLAAYRKALSPDLPPSALVDRRG